MLILFSEPYSGYIVESLYTAGFKRGEIVILSAGSGISSQTLNSVSNATLEMRETILAGSLVFRPAVYF